MRKIYDYIFMAQKRGALVGCVIKARKYLQVTIYMKQELTQAENT